MSDFFTLFMEKGSNYFVDFPILRKKRRKALNYGNIQSLLTQKLTMKSL